MRALIMTALLLAPPLYAQDQGQQQYTDITGRYSVEGRNPDGSAYSGAFDLTAQPPRYLGQWQIAGQSYSGVGTFDGTVLSLQWDEGAEPVVYVLMPDGELHGTWNDGRALERLEPRN